MTKSTSFHQRIQEFLRTSKENRSLCITCLLHSLMISLPRDHTMNVFFQCQPHVFRKLSMFHGVSSFSSPSSRAPCPQSHPAANANPQSPSDHLAGPAGRSIRHRSRRSPTRNDTTGKTRGFGAGWAAGGGLIWRFDMAAGGLQLFG